ncbi:hypothetical protein I2494_11080 [Budviciaceae bacterium BWR-B9]|uniref:Uncharacterized protein n=1 Tax=Limnobaculum allomyrinae TaxID=2791986 RepID=A0ABS1IR82_9GAMM|nr:MULTISPECIES: hypothetical protein [Limnobaculum]MBK5144253.1 hypothetical protein [Limnobaculum allomyrinae]MBV7692002.1 hypothetical protein [Limnobaculum sp. M2-1]
MKKLIIGVVFISGVMFTGSSFANVADLSCKFENGGDMLVTHDDDSIYIAYSEPKFSPDDNVIIIDKASKSTKQGYGNSDSYFTLIGTIDNGERAVIEFLPITENGVIRASLLFEDETGRPTEEFNCIPGTIKARSDLSAKGIPDVK